MNLLKQFKEKCEIIGVKLSNKLSDFESGNVAPDVAVKYTDSMRHVFKMYNDKLFQEIGRVIERIVKVKYDIERPSQSHSNRKRRFKD